MEKKVETKRGEKHHMTRPVNPLFNAIGLCTIMSTLDKMGVSPGLVARSASKAIGPILAKFEKMMIGTEGGVKNWDEFMGKVKMAVTAGGLGDMNGIEVKQTSSGIDVKWADCMMKDMVGVAKTFGYSVCPLCYPAIILTGTISAFNLADIQDVKIRTDGNICYLNLVNGSV